MGNVVEQILIDDKTCKMLTTTEGELRLEWKSSQGLHSVCVEKSIACFLKENPTAMNLGVYMSSIEAGVPWNIRFSCLMRPDPIAYLAAATQAWQDSGAALSVSFWKRFDELTPPDEQ